MIEEKEAKGELFRTSITSEGLRFQQGEFFWVCIDGVIKTLAMVESQDFDGVNLVVFAPAALQDYEPLIFHPATPWEVANYLCEHLKGDDLDDFIKVDEEVEDQIKEAGARVIPLY